MKTDNLEVMLDGLARWRERLRVPRRPTIPVVLWKSGRCVSDPAAAVADPPPAGLTVRCHRLHFASLEELVEHLTGGEPETEEYVLQYVKPEPRIAVYLYAPEALALLESA